MANLSNWNQTWINLDGFKVAFCFGSWAKRERCFESPPSTYTPLPYCQLCMKPASQLRLGPAQWRRVCEEFQHLRRRRPWPTRKDGRLCCRESGRELWTADWQRRGRVSRRKCKLLLLRRLTQHLQLRHMHSPHPRSRCCGSVLALAKGRGGGRNLTSCCPLLVDICNCAPLSTHLRGNKSFGLF